MDLHMYELFHVAIFKFSAKSFHTYLAYHTQKFYMHKNIDFCTYVVPESTFMISSKFHILHSETKKNSDKKFVNVLELGSVFVGVLYVFCCMYEPMVHAKLHFLSNIKTHI